VASRVPRRVFPELNEIYAFLATDPSGLHDGFGCSAVPRSASGKSPGGCRVAVALTTIAPRFQVG